MGRKYYFFNISMHKLIVPSLNHCRAVYQVLLHHCKCLITNIERNVKGVSDLFE